MTSHRTGRQTPARGFHKERYSQRSRKAFPRILYPIAEMRNVCFCGKQFPKCHLLFAFFAFPWLPATCHSLLLLIMGEQPSPFIPRMQIFYDNDESTSSKTHSVLKWAMLDKSQVSCFLKHHKFDSRAKTLILGARASCPHFSYYSHPSAGGTPALPL